MAFFQQQCFLKFVSYNPRDFKVLSTLQHLMFAQFFFKLLTRISWVFPSFNKYIYGQVTFWVFFHFSYYGKSVFEIYTKKKGSKTGKELLTMRSILKFSCKDLFGMKRFFPNKNLTKRKVSNVFTSQTSWSLLHIYDQTKLQIFRVGC